MRRAGSIVVGLPLIFAAACAAPAPTGPPPAPPPDLGGTWTVVRVGDLATVPGAEPRVTFPDNAFRIEVTTGCTELRGRVTIAGDRLSIAELVPVDQGPCPAPEREVEARLVALLAIADGIDGAAGRLRIASGGVDALLVRGDLELTDDEAALASRLEGGSWRLATLAGVPVPDGPPPASFAQGTFVALGLCGYGGRYRFVGEDLIRLSEIGWDAVAGCAPAIERLRSELAAVLEATDRLAFDGLGRAVLSGRAGEAVFVAE